MSLSSSVLPGALNVRGVLENGMLFQTSLKSTPELHAAIRDHVISGAPCSRIARRCEMHTSSHWKKACHLKDFRCGGSHKSHRLPVRPEVHSPR